MKYKDTMYMDRFGFDFHWQSIGKWEYLVICGYRYDPIPCTGGDGWWHGRYHRQPKTTQEHRWSCAHKTYTRGRRKFVHNLDPYDDGPMRSDHRDNNWKVSTKRKHQWRS